MQFWLQSRIIYWKRINNFLHPSIYLLRKLNITTQPLNFLPTRHKDAIHKEVVCGPSVSGKLLVTPESLLHPLFFKKYVNQSAAKLAINECYSERLRKEFIVYSIDSDDADASYQFIKDCITNFKGDAEKFYPSFYMCVSSEDIVFKNLSRRASVILGFEVDNLVLSHLKGAIVQDHAVDFSSCIKYLGGYVFGTLYKRIKRSKHCQSQFSLCKHLLTAGKSSCELDATNVLVHAKDRGELWTVNAEVLEIFCAVETHFRHLTSCAHRNIDSQKMVSELLRNSSVLCNFNKLRNITTEKVSKEIAFNLLEQLVLLYIRVRTFSWVKSKNDLEKIKSKKRRFGHCELRLKKHQAPWNMVID